MIKIVQFVRRKLKVFRSRRSWLISLALMGFITCLGFEWLGQSPLQAQYVPTVTSRNIWQYASFPVENFQTYTSGYGYRTSPVTGETQFHRGLDMAAPLGSYVRNWWVGRVISLSDHTACGTMIKIQSGQWQHIYCHLMGSVEDTPQGRYLIDRDGGIIIWQGQEIPAGVRIGRVGMTGRTTGSHLHWELKYEDQYINPGLVIKEMFRYQVSS
ncbi:MAG: M23 family metallopeptidase [cyanobacterium endosymbiont of Rhopalodia musculus]|uniref:M23 family metallopeptidase n=1 Tax=cyanobacterium endosymbiont of Epithemia clementina EcSB TaxID=3034674 RepID=UPI0024806AB9|nr:M23 family metallopeptidase [cyanobacterium endosymbiont of Epithemia clementina EcSB]WGT66785.1 M23 family metallopeptidase [cyanobacterium endosymbiont of Epithemia clementina EcSB]